MHGTLPYMYCIIFSVCQRHSSLPLEPIQPSSPSAKELNDWIDHLKFLPSRGSVFRKNLVRGQLGYFGAFDKVVTTIVTKFNEIYGILLTFHVLFWHRFDDVKKTFEASDVVSRRRGNCESLATNIFLLFG